MTRGHGQPGRDSMPGRARRRRWPIGLALLMLAGTTRAEGQAATPGASPWEAAVDRYLTGDRIGAATAILQTQASDLTRDSARAFDAWRIPTAEGADAEARRLVVRRLQASALLPMEILVTLSGRALASAH